jgi:hypothetical protein
MQRDVEIFFCCARLVGFILQFHLDQNTQRCALTTWRAKASAASIRRWNLPVKVFDDFFALFV